MFTGIIEETGTISKITKTAVSTHIAVTSTNDSLKSGTVGNEESKVFRNIKTGDSIAVNGVCLTVTHHSYGSFEADISPETMEISTLGLLKTGDLCNLERAIRAGEPFGGHFVTGHIDGTGKIRTVTVKGNTRLIKISVPVKLMKYIAAKGSVAIDGISLTPFSCTGNDFDVAVIPHTLKNTTLKEIQPGSPVNIECDILSKYIEQLINFEKILSEEKKKSGIDKDFLRKKGFLQD